MQKNRSGFRRSLLTVARSRGAAGLPKELVIYVENAGDFTVPIDASSR